MFKKKKELKKRRWDWGSSLFFFKSKRSVEKEHSKPSASIGIVGGRHKGTTFLGWGNIEDLVKFIGYNKLNYTYCRPANSLTLKYTNA